MNKKKLKDMMPLSLLHSIRMLNSKMQFDNMEQLKNTKKIFLCLVPHHGNLGDQAIIYATKIFLKDNFSEYKLIEIEGCKTYDYARAMKKILNRDDLLFLPGGGNMGDLYIVEEEPRRFIIDKYRDNNIISMPQTINFTNSNIGELEKKENNKSIQ